MAEIVMSDKLTLSKFRAVVFGPPGTSKSMSTLTISELCPKDFTHLGTKRTGERIELSDLLWVSFDQGATDGFAEQGYIVPQIDLSTVKLDKLGNEIRDVVRLIEERVAKGITKTVVIDTVSGYDEMLIGEGTIVKNLDKFELWAHVAAGHRALSARIKELPCRVIFLCHAKALQEQTGGGTVVANQQRVRQAQGVLTGVVPEISGKSLNAYRKDATFIFSTFKGAKRYPETAKAMEKGYYFIAEHPEFESKKRLFVPAVMPADWREVIRLIQA